MGQSQRELRERDGILIGVQGFANRPQRWTAEAETLFEQGAGGDELTRAAK